MRLYSALALMATALLLGGCQSPGLRDGEQVQFVQEVMRESAKISEGTPHAEQAVQAVRDWRGEGGDD